MVLSSGLQNLIQTILVLLLTSLILEGCRHNSPTLSQNWSVATKATQLSCAHVNGVDQYRLHKLHYSPLSSQEGLLWGEGWSPQKSRLLWHVPTRHMHIASHIIPALNPLTKGTRILGIHKNTDQSQLLIFQSIETHSPERFSVRVADFIHKTQIAQFDLLPFVYASDLHLTAIGNKNKWYLSGYGEDLHWTTLDLNDDQQPQVHSLSSDFHITAQGQAGMVISRLNSPSSQPSLTMYIIPHHHAQPPKTPLTLSLPHPLSSYALALTAPSQILIAILSTQDSQSSKPQGRQISILNYDLKTHTTQSLAELALDHYVSHDHLEFVSLHNHSWYLYHRSHLGDQKVLNIYHINTLAPHWKISGGASPLSLSSPPHPPSLTLKKWWHKLFKPKKSGSPWTHKVFGPLKSQDHISSILSHNNQLAVLIRNQNSQKTKTRHSICMLTL